jgi:hypothetical protein
MQRRRVPESCPSFFLTAIDYIHKKTISLIEAVPAAHESEPCTSGAFVQHFGVIENT